MAIIKEFSDELNLAMNLSNNPSTYSNELLQELYDKDDSPALRESILEEFKKRKESIKRLSLPVQPTYEQVEELIKWLTENNKKENQVFLGVSFTMSGHTLKSVDNFHYNAEKK